MKCFLKLERHRWALAALFLASFVSGCSPRTGIYFQSTRSCGNDDTWAKLAYYGLMLSPFVIPPLILLPAAGIGYSLDHYVFSPICDVVCMPFDFYLRNTGPHIKVVDTDGKPIPHAHVNAPIVTRVGTYTFTGKTDEQGLFYIPLSWKNSRLGRGDVRAEGFVSTPMDSPRLLRHRLYGTSWQQAKDGKVQHEVVMLGTNETLAPVVKSVVLNDAVCYGFALDIVDGDWCPPYGNGKVCDLQFRFEYGCGLPNQPGHGKNNCLVMTVGHDDGRRGMGIVKIKGQVPDSVDLSKLIGTNRTNIARIGLRDHIGKKPAIAQNFDAGKTQWAFHTDFEHGVYGIIKYLDCWGDINSDKRTVVLQYVYNPMLDCPVLTLPDNFRLPPPPKKPPKLKYIKY